MKGYQVFTAVCAMVLAMYAVARETMPESSINDLAAIGTNAVGGVTTNDTVYAVAKPDVGGVPSPFASTNAIEFAVEDRHAISNLIVETAMIRSGMLGISNRVDELIARGKIPKAEPSSTREGVRVVAVTNTVAAIDTELADDVAKKVNKTLERVESGIADLSRRLSDDNASGTENKDAAPQKKDRLSNLAVVLLVIAFIVLLAILALVIMVRASVSGLARELSEGRALLLDKLPGAVGENLSSRFEDMSQNRSRVDDQFNNLANAIGDLKEMLRDGLRSGEATEKRRVSSATEFAGGISSREEEEHLRMRVHELEVQLREKDRELSGMKDREDSAALKLQDEVKVAQENEARMRNELNQITERLAEATAQLERQSMPGLSFMSAEAFMKIKADLEKWRGEFSDETAVIESALMLLHFRKSLSKGTWSSALRDIAATISGLLERRGASPEAVRQTLNDWSGALDRLAQSSTGGGFALSVPQIGDQVDSSWMTTVGGALPSRVGAVRTWAVYIDGKIQCYAEVK